MVVIIRWRQLCQVSLLIVPRTVLCLESHTACLPVVYWGDLSLIVASSTGDDSYISPPSSRRTSEVTKLPSIQELEKSIPPNPELPQGVISPPKRASLATITEETPHPHQDHLPFPPKYPGSTIATIPKGRSNSYPPSNSATYPPPPPPPPLTEALAHQYQGPSPRTIRNAIDTNRYMASLVKDFDIVRPMLYRSSDRFKRSLDISIILPLISIIYYRRRCQRVKEKSICLPPNFSANILLV